MYNTTETYTLNTEVKLRDLTVCIVVNGKKPP